MYNTTTKSARISGPYLVFCLPSLSFLSPPSSLPALSPPSPFSRPFLSLFPPSFSLSQYGPSAFQLYCYAEVDAVIAVAQSWENPTSMKSSTEPDGFHLQSCYLVKLLGYHSFFRIIFLFLSLILFSLMFSMLLPDFIVFHLHLTVSLGMHFSV